MLSTMTERMTTEVQCRRYAASYLNLAKSSRSQSEKMLLLALAEWWLALPSERTRVRDLIGAAQNRA
jgi:hypothetical protein